VADAWRTDARKLAHFIDPSAINGIGDQHRPALIQTPHRPGVGPLTILLGYASRKDVLSPLGQLDLVGARESATASFLGEPASFLEARLLTLILGPHREPLIQLRRWRRAADLLLEFGNALLGRLELLLRCLELLLRRLELKLQGCEQIDETFNTDPSFAHVLSQCLEGSWRSRAISGLLVQGESGAYVVYMLCEPSSQRQRAFPGVRLGGAVGYFRQWRFERGQDEG
jgi:hypothetical protein